MAYNALAISSYLINYSSDIGKPISNLKLQKLLYYVQAAFLVELNRKCFDEGIVAWEYGPVVKDAYDKFKIYGRNYIPKQKDSDDIMQFDSEKNEIVLKPVKINLTSKEETIIKNVINSYKDIDNPFKLVEKTHLEKPWKETRQGDEISIKLMKDYYTNHPEKLYA